jgi:hypothetical protein
MGGSRDSEVEVEVGGGVDEEPKGSLVVDTT